MVSLGTLSLVVCWFEQFTCPPLARLRRNCPQKLSSEAVLRNADLSSCKNQLVLKYPFSIFGFVTIRISHSRPSTTQYKHCEGQCDGRTFGLGSEMVLGLFVVMKLQGWLTELQSRHCAAEYFGCELCKRRLLHSETELMRSLLAAQSAYEIPEKQEPASHG